MEQDTGAIVAVTGRNPEKGDTQSLSSTRSQAEASLCSIREESARKFRLETGTAEGVAGKGCHSDATLRGAKKKESASMSANRKGKRGGRARPRSRKSDMGIVAESAASGAGCSCAKGESGSEDPLHTVWSKAELDACRGWEGPTSTARNWRWPPPRTWTCFCAQSTESARPATWPTQCGRRSRPAPASLVRFLFC